MKGLPSCPWHDGRPDGGLDSSRDQATPTVANCFDFFPKTSLRTAQRRIRRSVPRNKVLLDDMDTCMHARRGQVAWIGRFA
jgi:hypothetical protein